MTNLLVIILGLPGAGKTTQVRRLKKKGFVGLHPGKFAYLQGLTLSQTPSREELLAIPGLTQAFLNKVDSVLKDQSVVLDGFPRSSEQAVTLDRLALERKWMIKVIYLCFPAGQELCLSIERQSSRQILEPSNRSAHSETAQAMRTEKNVSTILTNWNVIKISALDAEISIAEQITDYLMNHNPYDKTNNLRTGSSRSRQKPADYCLDLDLFL